MFIDLGKAIGGPDEGDGLTGSLLGIFGVGGAAVGSGVFDTVGGSGVADGFGAAAETAAAGFGRAGAAGAAEGGGFFTLFSDLLSDAWIMNDLGGGSFSNWGRKAWQGLSDATKEVAQAHGFMLQQLRSQGLTELAEKYAQLGTSLPDDALLKSTYRALANKFHPDKMPLGDEFFKMLTAANETLKNTTKTEGYNSVRLNQEGALQKFYAEFTSGEVNWTEKYTEAMRAKMVKEGRLLEEGAGAATGASSITKVSRWFSELSTAQKSGVVFGAVATVGVGVYLGAHWAEKYTEKKQTKAETLERNKPPYDLVTHLTQPATTMTK